MENETVSGSGYKMYQNSMVYGIIIDLRLSIDDYHGHLIRAKELIREIAKKLSQEWQFEKSTICTRIKEILEDKVKEGKITERWIEECLPSEYKRSYTKSELGSQLKKERNARATKESEDKQGVQESPIELQKILVTTDGTHLPSSQGSEQIDTKEYERLNLENKELKEALRQRDRESFSTADRLQEKEIEFKIPKERFDELHIVMGESERFCYIIFDAENGIFLRAKSDVSKLI